MCLGVDVKNEIVFCLPGAFHHIQPAVKHIDHTWSQRAAFITFVLCDSVFKQTNCVNRVKHKLPWVERGEDEDGEDEKEKGLHR